jgi:hypothetical protein
MLQTQIWTSTGKMRVRLLEVAGVLVRLDHVASCIVHANLQRLWGAHPEPQRNTNKMAAV